MSKPGTYVSHLRIACPSCHEEKAGTEFRGARFKTATCRTCEARYPASRWCIDCATWLPVDAFYRVGASQRFNTNRCKPCRALSTHGVTKAFMQNLTGEPSPRCGSCGDAGVRLSIDHDHDHCEGERGCEHCVRGYLCQPCNTAEGLLRTVDRARALVAYMERTKLTTSQLRGLPASTRTGRKRDRSVPGANRKYYVHQT